MEVVVFSGGSPNQWTAESCGKGHSHSHRITESQNQRMFGVGRELWGSSCPTPLAKQGHPEQAAQDLVQASFEYLQRRRIHSQPGQPVPVLCHPHRKEALPHVHSHLLKLLHLSTEYTKTHRILKKMKYSFRWLSS